MKPRKAVINSNREFEEWVTTIDPDYKVKFVEHTSYLVGGGMLDLEDLTFTELEIRDRHFESTNFKNVTFENCSFYYSTFFSCSLQECFFINCEIDCTKFLDSDLIKCKFEGCSIGDVEICDVLIDGTTFLDCYEIFDLRIRGTQYRKVKFQKCYIHFLDIEPVTEYKKDVYDFLECFIIESSFDRIDFSNSSFIDCKLSLNQFSACIFDKTTFQRDNHTPGNEYNLIDIRTILNSCDLNHFILEKLFGIHNPNVKDYFVELTSKIEFQSIFISYSFADKKFAKRINEELKKRGIVTFLWEKDAPGGKSLKEIMSNSVNSKDRILFIASANSIKSEACQFELSQGRNKQNKSWENVLYPIHIDEFLFELKKEQIRPIEFQEEYWKNVEELRRINSLSFVAFKNIDDMDEREFNRVLMRLITGLRKE